MKNILEKGLIKKPYTVNQNEKRKSMGSFYLKVYTIQLIDSKWGHPKSEKKRTSAARMKKWHLSKTNRDCEKKKRK